MRTCVGTLEVDHLRLMCTMVEALLSVLHFQIELRTGQLASQASRLLNRPLQQGELGERKRQVRWDTAVLKQNQHGFCQ